MTTTTRGLAYTVYQSHLDGDGSTTDAQANGYAANLAAALLAAFPGTTVLVEVVRRTQGVGSGLRNPDQFSGAEQSLIARLAERTQIPE